MRWRTLKKKKLKTPDNTPKILYAPFWPRALGLVTDVFMIGLPISLLMMAIFGHDQMHSATALDLLSHDPKAQTNPPNPIASLMQMGLFLIAFVVLWHRDGQTPGKKLARIRVVDATTYQRAPYWKLILRFFGYFLSVITIFGFFIGLLRRDKRTLHDLISGTAVIR